ncbi:MAG: hypothetical protein AAFS11_00900 [Planctomycetota bacterium]
MTRAQPDPHDQRIPLNEPSTRRTPLLPRLTRRLAGLRQSVNTLTTNPGIVTTPDGITYTPRARTTLAAAIETTGHLDFTVTFPATPRFPRKRIAIRATSDRVFHDLPPLTDQVARDFQNLLHAAIATTRPGDRVLLIGAGTGALTAALADHAGPSGAVTAFEADAQSVAFARARYPVANAAHERLTATTLAAEPPASAETIILTRLAPADLLPADPTALLSRVARPGSLLLTPPHAVLADAFRTLPGVTVETLNLTSGASAPDSAFVLVRKPPAA